VTDEANQAIRTFRGENFNETMAKAKMKFGEDLEVVETREVTEGGFLGFFGEEKVEVDVIVHRQRAGSTNDTQAKNNEHSGRQELLQKQIEKLSRDIRESRGRDTERRQTKRSTSSQEQGSNEWNVDEPAMPDFSPRDRARKIIQEKTDEFEGNGDGSEQVYSRPSRANPSDQTSSGSETSPLKSIMSKTEENEISRLVDKTDLLAEKVDSLIESNQVPNDSEDSPDFPGKLNDLFHRLVAQDMEKRFARELVGRVRKQLEAEEFHDMETIHKQLSSEVREDFVAPPALIHDEDTPMIIPFIGPTGVGKTTTIAKLAAYYDVEENRDVGFITLDGYRLAAVEQLRRYANILRVPLRDVTETGNMADAVDELMDQNVELIFVDTAGRSQFDRERIDELQGVFPDDIPTTTHLVLSATSRSRDLKAVLSGFEEIGFDRIAMTKLDETRSYGTVYNVMKRTEQPMAYFTDGQEVPDDLWIAEADQVANLIIEGTEE